MPTTGSQSEQKSMSPGIRYLVIGTHKEGWWNYEKFAKQLVDFIDCFQVMYPGHQLMFETDWSAGHGQLVENGLNATGAVLNYGSDSKCMMRPTTVRPEHLGNELGCTWAPMGRILGMWNKN